MATGKIVRHSVSDFIYLFVLCSSKYVGYYALRRTAMELNFPLYLNRFDHCWFFSIPNEKIVMHFNGITSL